MQYVYTMEYYSVIKKKEIVPLAATQMVLERVILSEVSQTEKEEYHMTSLICGIWNELTKQKETHKLRKWTYDCQEWMG